MKFKMQMSLRWRLLAGFLLAASMTILCGISGMVSLQRIHNHMSFTAEEVDKNVRQQTVQTNAAIHLRDVLDEINNATVDKTLVQIENNKLTFDIPKIEGSNNELNDLHKLIAAKRQQLASLETLAAVDQAMAKRMEEVNVKISDIVDSVTFAVLLGIEDVINKAATVTDANQAAGGASSEELAGYVDRALTKIKSAMTARTSLLELNVAFKDAMLARQPEGPTTCAVIANNLYANLEHQLSPLVDEEGIDRIQALVAELAASTPTFLGAKTAQIQAAEDFKGVFHKVLGDVRQRSLTVVANAETMESDVRQEFEGSSRFATRSMVFLVSIALVAFVMSLVIGAHMARSFATSITAVVTRVKDVADGDLTQGAIRATTDDEIGSLAKHFNVMVQNLKGILGSTQEVAARINGAGLEILSISDAQSAGAREQSCAVSQTTSAAAELSKTSEQIGENIKTISQMAKHVLTGMGKIKSATDQTNKILISLNEKSKQIGNITELIDDVADQTNLLAVNAAIEAARAGEQGRGFTVVADQIGKLADSTAKSTKDITSLVEMIQHEMSNAIIAMEQSLVGVEEEIQLAKDSAAKSQEIAMSANQQISGSRQIAEAMASIDQTMKQIVFGSQRSSEAASQLSGLADELKGCMSRFRVSSDV
jgi:methyl-accepting chemotaxis protein